MLIDHAEAERVRGARIADDLLPVVDHQLAVVGLVIAHDAFDQRRFAGAVLAEQRVERAGPDLQRNLVERGELAEALGHVDRFDAEGFLHAVGDGSRRADQRGHLAHAMASMNFAESDTAPNTPPCILTILMRVVVIAPVGGAAAILQQQAFEAAIVGLAHGGVHADVGGDAGQHDVLDAAQAQHQFEIGGAERALAGLVDDRLAVARRQLGNDLPAGLAAHQDAAARPGIADAGADLPRAPALVGGQIGEIGAMAFAGVDDVEALGARGGERALDRLDRRAGQRQVVAHLVDIAADAAEIGLHVDDDQRGVLRTQIAVIRPGIGIGGDVALRRSCFPCVPIGACAYLVIDSSAGAPISVRFGEQVAIMISSVRI